MFVVLAWFSARPRPTRAVSGVFSLMYGTVRFLVEFYREPDGHIDYLAMGWMTRGQMLSLPMIALGVYLIVTAYGSVSGALGKTEGRQSQ